MSGVARKVGIVGLLITWGAIAQAADRPEPTLSAAEMAVVTRQIATLKTPEKAILRKGGAMPRRWRS
jgi:hypothetical protein